MTEWQPLPRSFRHLFADKQLKIIAYCAEEVRRQRDTPVHVSHMLRAWEHAWTQWRGNGRPMSSELIREIGALVEPDHNSRGFRTYDVRVGNDVKMHWEAVPRAIEVLCQAWNEGLISGFVHKSAGAVGPAEEFYYRFEAEIHPFGDGNGRTGKILFNMLRGTLDDPQWPPDFFGGIENP